MQIQSQKYNYSYKPIPHKAPLAKCSSDKVSFSGFRSKDAKALIALDLDGTFAHGTNEDIQKVLKLAKKANATLIYATGRTMSEVEKLRKEMRDKGVDLPMPKFLVANNGQFVYKNVDGKFVEDLNWRAQIKAKTNFDRDIVYKTIHNIAHRSEYKFDEKDWNKFNRLEGKEIALRKEEDSDFWNSKISYYEWNASPHMVEYFVASDVDVQKLKKTIKSELKEQGIKTKFLTKTYSKKIMDACDPNLIRQSLPVRADSNGAMKVLFCCPADKADGVKYVSQKLGISHKEILMAGNDNNDFSMADFSSKGAFFVCVSNAVKALKDYSNNLKSPTMIFADKEGAAGIAEGIEKVLNKFRPDLNT